MSSLHDPVAGGSAAKARTPNDPQPLLPCQCGCGAPVLSRRARFLSGHYMKVALRTPGGHILPAPPLPSGQTALAAPTSGDRLRTCPECGRQFSPRTDDHVYCSKPCWGKELGRRKRLETPRVTSYCEGCDQ